MKNLQGRITYLIIYSLNNVLVCNTSLNILELNNLPSLFSHFLCFGVFNTTSLPLWKPDLHSPHLSPGQHVTWLNAFKPPNKSPI